MSLEKVKGSRFLGVGLAIALLAALPVLKAGIRVGDIYDESADGSKQVADAVTKASKDGKRVLLDFGANWCGWCHKLHNLFETDQTIAATLKGNYIVVMIDVNGGRNRDVNSKYGNPTRFGLPVLVVLDAAGKPLTTKDSGELEEGDHHSPAKVLAFLKKWAPEKT
jgi:thiol:disulfide interchange protein